MAIEAEIRAHRLRIISGNPQYIEAELNRLLSDFTAIQWNYSVVEDELRITVVLFASSEIRKQQLMAGPMMGRQQ